MTTCRRLVLELHEVRGGDVYELTASTMGRTKQTPLPARAQADVTAVRKVWAAAALQAAATVVALQVAAAVLLQVVVVHRVLMETIRVLRLAMFRWLLLTVSALAASVAEASHGQQLERQLVCGG